MQAAQNEMSASI